MDLVVRGGRVVTAGAAPAALDVGIADGIVVALAPELSDTGGAAELDARGLLVLPGVVDPHVHLNEPGRTDWEGFATGTAAMAGGGTTTCLDMPLNAHPPTVDAASFDAKVAALEGVARVDVGLWGGIVPGPLEHLDELAARGVLGLKAFMSDTGTDDFQAADDDTLHAGMVRAAALGLVVGVHCEDRVAVAAAARQAIAEGRTGVRDYLASRPVETEHAAIARCIALAADAGCALHVVHVSTGGGVALVADARAAGQDVTCEVCVHHLLLDADDAERLGAVAKCAPPLRAREEVEAMWAAVHAGDVALIATDHSPSPADMKTGDDAFAWWGGISGAQLLLAPMLDAGLEPRALAELLSGAAARRYSLTPRKGAIAPGADADLVLVDPEGRWEITPGTLHDRHKLSPLLGRTLRGAIRRTLLRGETIAIDGTPVGPPLGRLLTR